MSMKRNFALGLAAAAVSAVAMGSTAIADHAHFVVITNPVTGVRTCQYLAHHTSEAAANHPLHYLVHLGTPGFDTNGNDVDKAANEGTRCDVVRG